MTQEVGLGLKKPEVRDGTFDADAGTCASDEVKEGPRRAAVRTLVREIATMGNGTVGVIEHDTWHREWGWLGLEEAVQA